MCKKHLLLMTLLALFVPWAANAQETVTIGEGTATSNTNPIGTYYNYSITEQLYTADEIGMAGTISSISFYYKGTAAKELPITVYMKHVDEENLASAGISLADADEVFSGTLSVTTTAGWVTIDLDTPFAYDGTSNLLIGCIKDYLYYFNGQTWQGTATTATMARYTQNDDNAYTTSQVPSTAQANRPNIQMVITAGGGPTCLKPKNLQATLTPGNGSIATLSWTESGTATDWVLEYGTADDFTGATSVNVSGTPTKDLTGLVAEMTYYARVKADCGGDESAWSATCEFTPTNALTITVCDGTTTNTAIPFDTYSTDTQGSTGEFVIPASELTTIAGAEITNIQFYISQNYSWTATFKVYVKEVDYTTLSGVIGPDAGTVVYTGTFNISDNIVDIPLDNSYEYNGGNLLIGTYISTSGNYISTANFYGIEATGAAYASGTYNGQNDGVKNFIPKTTFAYESNAYPKPKNLAVSNLTNNSATLTWEAPNSGTPTGYKYQYMPQGGTWTDLTSTTSLSANLEGLTANTTYAFQVQAIYSDGESVFANTTFTTECDAFAIPYEYGFEDANDMNCWALANGTTNTGIWDNATLGFEAARTGDYCFMFYYVDYPDTDPQYQTLISPELTDIVAGLHVEFYYRKDETNGLESFKVGYSTTNKDLSSFTWGDVITNATGDYKRFSANYPADVKYVAIQHTSDDQYYLFIDDILFEEAPSCLEPTHVMADNITTTGATITWTPGADEEQWGLYVTTDITDVPDGTTVPTITPVTTTSYELTTLTPATTYYVYVQADCRDASAWSSPVTFNTLCEGMDLPFTYGFEDDALSVCWGVINTNTSYNSVGISSGAPHEGSKSLSFYCGSTTGDLVVVLPVVSSTYDLSDYQIEYYAKASNTYVNMAIGIMTDPEDITTFVAQGEAFNPATSYTKYRVRFNGYTGTGNYVAIKVSRASGSSGYIYLDDLYVSAIPACLETTDPVVSEITAHTAKLDWTGTSAGYNLEYRSAAYMNGFSEAFNTSGVPSGWTQYTGLVDEVIAGTATLASGSGWGTSTYGLGTYNLRLNIYGTSRKHWVVTPEFTLADGSAMSFDLALTAYNGNGAASGTCDDDRFAVLVFADDAWTILREWNNSGSSYVYNDIATTGETVSDIDISAYVGKTVKFAFYGESTVSSNGDNDLHIDNVSIGTPVPAGEWQTATSTEPTATLTGLTAETPYEVRVQGNCGAQGVGEWSNFVTFTTTIACPAPTGLAYANLKSTQVDLSWTNGGADNWIVAYKQTADTDFTEVSVSSADVTLEGNTVTYTLTGLTEETAYTVKVSDNCEVSYPGDGTSEWTSTVSFTTMAACSVDNVTIDNIGHYTADVTWNGESASGFTVSYRTAADMNGFSEAFNTSGVPSGWTQYTGLVDEVIAGTATLASGSGWGTSTYGLGTYNLRLNIYGTSRKHWVVTPEFTLADGSAMSFDLALTAYNGNGAASGTCDDDRFAVLVFADDAWTILREWNNSGSHYVYTDIATTGETVSDIDISAYVGKTVKFAFYGESTVSGNGDNDLHIDNLTIGIPVAAGEWQTLSATESPANLTGLTVGTKYDVKVAPNCDASLESDIVTFSTVSGDLKYFLTEGNWDVAANWEPEGAPTLTQTVDLRANATIPSGCVAEAKSISGTATYSLTIENDGQLKTDNNVMNVTVKKNITAFPDMNVKSGYYLISNPTNSTITPSVENGLLDGDYDFYNWSNNASDGLEWRNYAASSFTMTSGLYGYLYANAVDTELSFTGTVRASNSSQSRYLSAYEATAENEFKSWYLIGNPFVCDAYLVNASTDGTALPYYRMNDDGDDFEAVTSGPVHAMEGIFYEATSNASVYMTRTAPNVMSNGNGNLNIVLAQNVTARGAKGSTDNAIIRFDGGEQLGKFSFNANNAKIYIPQDGKDYAIVSADAQGEMPVNFKTAKNGSYTLSFTSEDVNFSYLHLIDNMTGNDVDLLANPSYTFDARTTDYASRFRLVFATGANAGEDFAFFSNGNLVINNDGEATLQVVDVMGHVISSKTISGSESFSLNAATGVYMLRLINGNDVKVQKIVVR